MTSPALTQLMTEWEHVRQTRLGIMCEDRQPTPEQECIAHEEADKAVLAMQGLRKRARYRAELAGTWAARSGKD